MYRERDIKHTCVYIYIYICSDGYDLVACAPPLAWGCMLYAHAYMCTIKWVYWHMTWHSAPDVLVCIMHTCLGQPAIGLGCRILGQGARRFGVALAAKTVRNNTASRMTSSPNGMRMRLIDARDAQSFFISTKTQDA